MTNIDDLRDDLSAPRVGTFNEFASRAIFRNLGNLTGFRLSVKVPRMYQWVGTPLAPDIGGRMFEEVWSVFESAGFFALDQLDLVVSNTQVGVSYRDDEFQCEIYFDDDGDLVISRDGSSMERFFNWYVKLMPSVMSLVDRLLNTVVEAVQLQKYGKDGPARSQPELRPVSASFQFRLVAYGIKRPPSLEIEKNAVILQKLLPLVPGEAGELQDSRLAVQSSNLSRLDVALSRWSNSAEGGWAREIYSVQAPANRRSTTLWFDFGYQGQSYESPDGVRSKFDSRSFLGDYETPLFRFFRDRAAGNFLSQLTEGCIFETSVGVLP